MDVPTEVIESCKRGQAEAFEELIRLTQRDVYSLSLRLTGNPHDAADVTQDTYIRLWKSIRSFRGEAKFSTWLYQVTSSVAISSLRKRARRRLEVSLDAELFQPGHQEHWVAPASGEPAAELDRHLLGERLDAALAGLPEGYRMVVVLRDVYGLALEEIGEQLGITEGAAKVRLHRARQKLKDVLSEDAPAEKRPGRRKRAGGNGDGVS